MRWQRSTYLVLLLIMFSVYGFTLIQYNLLNISGIDDTWVDEREPYLETALIYLSPDILVTQEIFDRAGAEIILEKLREAHDDYEMAHFIDGRDSDNMLYYRSSKFSLLEQYTIRTELRDISGYLILAGSDSLYIYSAHLKASSGSSNEAQRERESRQLRQHLRELPDDAMYILCGDLNLYSGDEDAFRVLTASGNGQLLDPLDNDDEWHNNESLAYLHTQSTRTTNFFGGATGGLDDRFDFILLSPNLMDGDGVDYIPGSYTAIANDGEHFNRSINEPPISGERHVVNALYNASDHLPVQCEILIPDAVAENSKTIEESRFYIHPNPFNSICHLHGEISRLHIFDIYGQKIETIVNDNFWQPSENIGTGIFFLQDDESGEIRRALYIK